MTCAKTDELIKKSILIEDGNPARYRLKTTTDNQNQSKSYRKITFGERDPEKTHKTILMVGETGTGKTALINTMINYICGVQREDKIWFEITDDQSDRTSVQSQTSIITVYGVYIPESSRDLTIIDTPGYGNTIDEKIATYLLSLCTSKDGIHEIDAVCFVIKADQNRFSDRQQYIFDAVQCLFGEDIKENIVLLFTHSNGLPPKNALTAVKETQVKSAVDEKKQPIYFLFDNCQSETFDEEYQTIQDQLWDLSHKGMTGLIHFLDMTQPKTLQKTQDEQELLETKSSKTKQIKTDQLIKKSVLIEDGNPARYRLKTTTDNLHKSGSYRKITFGERDPEKTHKTILMVGETGTGKTALINTMINYICGVQREDKIWFEITDDQSDRTSVQSQTSIITVYGVYIPETSVDLTIVDTPGYKDTSDINSHQKITSDLLNLCSSDDGLNEIDAVCLVIKADQTRLTDSQRCMYDAIQSLFGENVKENIVLLFTHSNGLPPKNALTAVKETQVKSAVDEKKQPIYFLFDNLGCNGMEGFFTFLDSIRTKALRSTRDVLLKRQEFKNIISHLKPHVEMIEQKQNELKQAQNDLEKHKNENNFEKTVEVLYKVKVDIDLAVAYKALCCTVCKENCHYPGCWWFCDYFWCSAIKNNRCTVCTNKCHYNKHVKENKIYETKTKTEKKIDEDLKKKYDDTIENSQSVVNNLKEELQELEKEKIMLVADAFNCVDVLEKIALNTHSLFVLQHIDFLIEKMKEIKQPEKAETLENIKKRAGEKHEHSYC